MTRVKAAVKAGLCSITFRTLAAEEVLTAAVDAELAGIEWGADVHVQVGDLGRATAMGRRCADVGLACPSYGTYLMAGRSTTDDGARAADTAGALGVTNLRIWAPFGVLPDAPATEREEVAAGVDALAAVAAERGLTTSLEFHPGTLTETAASTLDLLSAVNRPNLFTYWQPNPSLDDASALEELAAVRPRLSHLHVFSWGTGFDDRQPLADGAGVWERALEEPSGPDPWTDGGRERYAFLEYVLDDDPANLPGDAVTLRTWLGAGEPTDA